MSINTPLALMVLTFVWNLGAARAQDRPPPPAEVVPVAPVVPAAAAAKPAPIPSKPSPMEQNWLDLEKQEAEAVPALLRMAKTPKESIEFLKTKLKPLKIDPEGVTQLLVKLDNEDEKVWKAAFEELEYFDPRLAIDVKTLADNVTSKPLRQRMMEVLVGQPAGAMGEQDMTLNQNGGDNFTLMTGNSGWWLPGNIANLNMNQSKKKWTRATRAVMLLEYLNTPEALALLQEMAGGHPEAGPTMAAVAAVNRIEGKDKAKDKEPKKDEPKPTPVAPVGGFQ